MMTGYYCKPEAIVITSIAAQQRILRNWLNIGAEKGGPAGFSRAHHRVDESVAVELLLELAPLLGFEREGCSRARQ